MFASAPGTTAAHVRPASVLLAEPGSQSRAPRAGLSAASPFGTELLRTGPDERLTLTAYGWLFARDVAPALESLAQSRSQATSHTP